MTATTGVVDCLRTALELDFVLACSQLADARRRQREKDSISNRKLVTDCQSWIDAILDMHLQTSTIA